MTDQSQEKKILEKDGLAEMQFDYAWKWFDFHAKQRTTMFNFFMAFAGLFINGVFLLLKERFCGIAFHASWIGAVITVAFLFIDYRNTRLIGYAEEVLFWLERNWIFKNSPRLKEVLPKDCLRGQESVRLSLLWRERQPGGMRGKFAQHCFWIPIMQLIVLLGFIVLTIFLWGFHCKCS